MAQPSAGSPAGAGGRSWLVVVALLALHAVLALTGIGDKSQTYDEAGHIGKGLVIWTAHDYRFMPTNPPLPQLWATWPLLDDGLTLPARDQPLWYESDFFGLGDQLMHDLGNDPAAILFTARSMIVVLSLALGLVVFLCARRLFGVPAALTSLALYALSPSILAHARLATADLASALCFLLAVLAVWRSLQLVSATSVLAGGLALGGLFLTKTSAFAVLPMIAVLVAVRLTRGDGLHVRLLRPREVDTRGRILACVVGALLVQGLLAWTTIWAAHGFRYEAMVDAQPGRDRFSAPLDPEPGVDIWAHQGREIPTVAATVDWARERRLLPEAYLYGFLTTMQGARGRDAFLDGERSLHGWWQFFPAVFLYKLPLPILALMLLGAAALLRGRAPAPDAPPGTPERLADTLQRTAPLWVLIGVYWVVIMTSSLNIGLRHLLPVLAPTFVLCGAATSWLGRLADARRFVVPALLVGLAGVSLTTWPHYLASFNLIAGGSANGYRHLVDSSLDWGQDLPGLQRWLAENAGDEKVYLSYFGRADWRHAGIQAQSVPYGLRSNGAGDYTLTAGLYCISATRLQQLYTGQPTEWTDEQEQTYQTLLPDMRRFEQSPNDAAVRSDILRQIGPGFKPLFDRFQLLRFARLCAWLRQREPDDDVGHSILIYRLTDEDIEAALYSG